MKRAAAVLVLALAATPATPCAFDGVLDAGFGADDPRAYEVAIALARFHVGEPTRPTASAEGRAGFWRVSGLLSELAARLNASGGPALVVSLVDVSLTARVADGAAALHAAPAGPGETALFTDTPVLERLSAGALTAEAALATGIVIIDGPASDGARAALARAFAAPAARPPGRAAFGR